MKRAARAHARGAAQQPRPGAPRRKPPALDAIKHVIYVIKENRTYDQVLGDLGKGDGDPALTLFNEDSAPNHHELARRFTLFDNFYADADVSGGRPQLDDVGGGDRLRRQDVADHLLARRARGATARATSSTSTRRAVPDRAARRSTASDVPRGGGADARLPVGQRVRRTASRSATTAMYTAHPGRLRRAPATRRRSRTSTTAASATTSTSASRASTWTAPTTPTAMPEWEREFAAYEAQYRAEPSKDPLPALTILRLPNDHTYGTTPGKAIPEGYMADNDLALGPPRRDGLEEPVLDEHRDPRDRGRRAERARPRRRAPHARLRDQPVHADGARRLARTTTPRRWWRRSRTCSGCRR